MTTGSEFGEKIFVFQIGNVYMLKRLERGFFSFLKNYYFFKVILYIRILYITRVVPLGQGFFAERAMSVKRNHL